MAEIDVTNDLEQVNQQLEQLVAQLNQINTQREQLAQQIHNLNGIAMYLRGKDEVANGANGTNVAEDLERSEGYPDIMTKET